jgi:hypothetical protein
VDRQRVHVGADRQHGTGAAALDQADDTGPADTGAVADAQALKLARDDAGGAHLLEAEFRMRMDVAADFDQGGLDPLGGVADRGGRVIGEGHDGAFAVRPASCWARRTIARRRAA